MATSDVALALAKKDVEIARLRKMGLELLDEWMDHERDREGISRPSPEAEYQRRKAEWERT
jgi:hypothetical protein